MTRAQITDALPSRSPDIPVCPAPFGTNGGHCETALYFTVSTTTEGSVTEISVLPGKPHPRPEAPHPAFGTPAAGGFRLRASLR